MPYDEAQHVNAGLVAPVQVFHLHQYWPGGSEMDDKLQNGAEQAMFYIFRVCTALD